MHSPGHTLNPAPIRKIRFLTIACIAILLIVSSAAAADTTDQARALCQQGETALYAGQYQQALDAFDQCLAVFPGATSLDQYRDVTEADVWVNKGDAYIGLKQYGNAVTVSSITVGAQNVTGADVTLNVTSEVQNTYGVSSGVSRVQLKAYDIGSGLVVAEQTGDAGYLGIRGSGSISQTFLLPRKGSYRLVSTVFENGQRKGQGELIVYNLERLTPDIQETGLAISDIDFLVKKVSGDHVNIQTDVYFTNDNRAASGPFEIEVKAKEEDARLLADKQRASVESVQPDATRVSSVTLSVPDQYNYVVEVLVWKNDTIVKRGEGNVRLRPGMQVDKNTEFVTKQIETSKFVQDSGSPVRTPAPYTTAKPPGFGAPLVIIALVSLAGLVHLGRRRQ